MAIYRSRLQLLDESPSGDLRAESVILDQQRAAQRQHTRHCASLTSHTEGEVLP